MWGYPASHAHTFPPTTPPSYPSQMYIRVVSIVSSKRVGTSDRSRAGSWSQPWAPSRPRPCPWSQRPRNLGFSERYTIFPTHTTFHPMPHRSTRTLTATISPAPGEHSRPSLYSSPACLPDPKLPSATSRRHTELSPSNCLNGPGSSSSCRRRTNLRSTPAITSVSPQEEGPMGCWPMQEQTFFEEKVWAPSQSGWTTIYSFGSPRLICLDTTSCARNGASKYRRMAAAGRRAAAYGTGERCYRAATRRSSTRIAPLPSKTCLPTPHAPQKIKDLLMQMPILTGCQHVWASNGRHPSQCPSDRKSLIWAFSGTYMRGRYTSQTRKNSSISLPSPIGAENAHTTFSRRKNFMASCCTRHWSSLQDELTSPAWRPCSPLFTMVLSSRIPLPEIPRTTWPGGSSSLAAPASSPPSSNPNPSSTTGPIRTQALASAWLSRLARDGVHGALPPSGSLKEETSSGPKPLASSSWSSAFVNYQRRAITSSSMETIAGSSKDGGKSVAPTGLQTSSSIISSNFRRIAAE